MIGMNKLAGAICILTGIAMAALASSLPLGSLSRMGPGYMPMAIGIGLAVIGGLIVLFDRDPTGIASAGQMRSQLRALGAVLAAIALFALLIDHAGLIPTSALSAFTASWAMRDITMRARAILAAVIAAICAAIFYFGLGLPISLIGG